MGDDCNVVPRRNEESTSSSSPKIATSQRIKNLEKSRNRDLPSDERESLFLARQSGEPGEEIHKIMDIEYVADDVLPEHHETTVTEPLLFVSSVAQSAIPGFPYSETKLRPDAPPFTPESLTRSGPTVCGISDTVCSEPDFVPRCKIDESCFVNVDLRIPMVDQETTVGEGMTPISKGKRIVSVPRTPQPMPGIRDLREPIRDPGLKPFSLTPTPRLKRSMPKVEPSIDSLHANAEMNEAVAASAESGANEPEIRETDPELAEPRIIRGHWRILRTTFIIGNRIQIAVFIASIVLCVVIVIYVFV